MRLVLETPNLSSGIKLECIYLVVIWGRFTVGLSAPSSLGGRGTQKPCILSRISGVHRRCLEVP